MAAKDKSKDKPDDADVIQMRSVEETARHKFADQAALDPTRIYDLVSALDDLIDIDDDGKPSKKKKKKADPPPPNQKPLLYGVLTLLIMVLSGQVASWVGVQFQELNANVEQILTGQEATKDQIDGLQKHIDLVSEDYEVMERALVDYISSQAPGSALPDSVIILRDRHSRTQ